MEPEIADRIRKNDSQEGIPTKLSAMLSFAEELTRNPAGITEAHTEALHAAGLDDLAIHRLVQVIAYFNYINRLADGLGVDLEPEMPRR